MYQGICNEIKIILQYHIHENYINLCVVNKLMKSSQEF